MKDIFQCHLLQAHIARAEPGMRHSADVHRPPHTQPAYLANAPVGDAHVGAVGVHGGEDGG